MRLGQYALPATLFLLIITLDVPAIDPGVAKGSLNVDKQAIELKHAYAFHHDNAEGLLDGAELRILLADRKLADDILAGFDGPMRLQSLVRSGNLRGVLLRFDPQALSKGFHGTLLYPPSNPQATLLFFSVTGSQAIKELKSANNRVVGAVDYEMTSSRSDSDVPQFKFAVSFSAPLFREEPVTATITGAAAPKSGPAQTLLAFEGAIRNGNLALAKTLVTAEKWSSIEKHRTEVGEGEFARMVRLMIPAPAKRSGQIRKVFVRGARAVMILDDGSGQTVMSFVREQDKWKVN